MNAKEFFDKLKPWSKRKHRLLGKYLPPFSAKVATTTRDREIYCVDAFAGAAKYGDGNEGSPLLIARFSDDCAKWVNPVFLKLINVEPDLENEGIFESLEDATQIWKEKGVVENIRKEFHSAMPDILSRIGNSPALFFIDPLGPTQVYFSHLQPLLTRSQNRITELIVNFDTDGLYRITRAALSKKINPKTAETDAQNVTDILGSSNWRQKLETLEVTTEEGQAILLNEYVNNLQRFGYDVVAYPIRESLNKNPEYYFIYCTRHRDGIALMNDFIREEEDLLYGEHVEDRLPLFQDEASLSREKEARQDKLRFLLKLYLEDHLVVTRKQIKQDLLISNFGYFHSNEYNSVVRGFIDEKTLREETGKTRINDTHVLKYFPKK